jgi:REP element-mobilizing transposase RayT
MLHHAFHARSDLPIFRNAEEAARLWNSFARSELPIVALCLMPDHIHLLAPIDLRAHLRLVLSGYSRWRQGREGLVGGLFTRSPPPRRIATSKISVHIRYIHLNPCRAGLIDDPLAWPWSTHRDALGYAIPGLFPPYPRAAAFHRFVCNDGHVHPQARDLPTPKPDVSPQDILAAVSSAYRVPRARLALRSPERTAAIAAAKARCNLSISDLKATFTASESTIRRATLPPDATRILLSMAGHSRFAAIDDADTHFAHGWVDPRWR